MINPQIIKLDDAVIAIDGTSIIDDATQIVIGVPETPHADIQVDINFYDITAGSTVTTITDAAMEYKEDADYWVISLSAAGGSTEIDAELTDRHKYVARISENSGAPIGMRDFKLEEFAVDDEITERMPFEIDIGTPSYIKWYGTGDISGTVLYKAKVYEGGVGITDATSPEKVTHRDEIKVGP